MPLTRCARRERAHRQARARVGGAPQRDVARPPPAVRGDGGACCGHMVAWVLRRRQVRRTGAVWRRQLRRTGAVWPAWVGGQGVPLSLPLCSAVDGQEYHVAVHSVALATHTQAREAATAQVGHGAAGGTPRSRTVRGAPFPLVRSCLGSLCAGAASPWFGHG